MPKQATQPASDEPVRIAADIPFISPPQWAILERSLIDLMNRAIEPVLARYVHGDGSTMWPPTDEMTNWDGLDDAYESFHNWPLFYLLGGDDRLLEVSNREFNAITLQFTRYQSGHGHPMVVKEYEQGYDWMHQGEGYVFFYLLCMADPTNTTNRRRARRFAGFYLNEDPEAPNYDEQHKIIKSPHNGSKGPAQRNFERYYTKYRYEQWQKWPLPFYDVPGCETVEDLRDPEIEDRMGQAVIERFARGDCAANLAATSMVANAYLFTGDAKYKQWVEEYVGAWMERLAANNGILPDNVGLSGEVGEYLGGRWYGGYYGWTWPHGWHTMGDAVLSGAENAMLVSGDLKYLELARSQIDVMMDNGELRNGTLYVPHYHHDKGWDGYSPMQARFMAHLWSISLDPADMERIDQQRDRDARDWEEVQVLSPKDRGGHEASWLAYLRGEFPDYPEEILRYNHAQVYQRLAYMEHDEQDPATYGDHYLQVRNPITTEGLVQLTMGGPLFNFNGGLLLVRLRYFDWQHRRPGLPRDVAALVEKLAPEGAVLRLVNLSAVEARELVVQAGAFGEHQFTTARFQTLAGGQSHDVFSSADWLDADAYRTAMAREVEEREVAIDAPHFRVALRPGSELRLDLGMERFVNTPSYELPWTATEERPGPNLG